MPSTRTTSALIRNAIEAARDAGMAIGAVEVGRGGVVRILPPEAVTGHADRTQAGGNTCDALFQGESD